jgi:hypothetical protein
MIGRVIESREGRFLARVRSDLTLAEQAGGARQPRALDRIARMRRLATSGTRPSTSSSRPRASSWRVPWAPHRQRRRSVVAAAASVSSFQHRGKRLGAARNRHL